LTNKAIGIKRGSTCNVRIVRGIQQPSYQVINESRILYIPHSWFDESHFPDMKMLADVYIVVIDTEQIANICNQLCLSVVQSG
jgi:hypothetical protein